MKKQVLFKSVTALWIAFYEALKNNQDHAQVYPDSNAEITKFVTIYHNQYRMSEV